MTAHEFVSVAAFYMQNTVIQMSKPLMLGFFAKISDCVAEFNELQLIMLKQSIQFFFM
jgi:hypothetical protein